MKKQSDLKNIVDDLMFPRDEFEAYDRLDSVLREIVGAKPSVQVEITEQILRFGTRYVTPNGQEAPIVPVTSFVGKREVSYASVG